MVFDPDANGGAGAHRSKTCICQKIARAKAGEIPPEFQGKSFGDLRVYQKGWSKDKPEDPGNVTAIAMAKDFIVRTEEHLADKMGLFFYGEPGRGKSLLCSIIFQELCNMQYYPVYLHLRQFLDRLIDSYRGDSDVSETQLFEVIGEADVVILDELRITRSSRQRETDSDQDSWRQEKVLKIVEAARVLITDSNYDLQWIARNLGPHIASRIHGRCGTPIIVGGPDHRALNGQKLQQKYLSKVAT